jgi:hypothetical protein
MNIKRVLSPLAALVVVFGFLGQTQAAPTSYAALYFRVEEVTSNPFAYPTFNDSATGTNYASLTHTSLKGSNGWYEANATAGTLKGYAHAVNGHIGLTPGDEVWASGYVRDSFTLNGPSSGVPVSITITFAVDGTLSGSGGPAESVESKENAWVRSQFTVGSNNDVFSLWARTEAEMANSWTLGGGAFSVPVHRQTSFNLDIVPGSPFEIYYYLAAGGGWAYGGSGGTSAFGSTGSISFILPAGASITSEGGYAQSAVPLPPTLLLLGPVIVGVIGLKRKYLG